MDQFKVLCCNENAHPGKLEMYGKINNVLSSSCEESDLEKISHDLSFGLGASSGLNSKAEALGEIGESICVSEEFMTTRPAYPDCIVDSYQTGWSPFLVGWEHDPQLLIRLDLNESIFFSSLIGQLNKTINSESPILGFFGIVSCQSDLIVHKRLKKSPIAINRGMHKAFDSSGLPFSISSKGFDILFAQDKIPEQTHFIVVGIITRPYGKIWESFGGKDVEQTVRNRAFYSSPGDSGSASELLSHTHFIVPNNSKPISLDSVNGFSDMNSNIQSLLGAKSPLLVSHLETSTKINDGVLAIVNLAPPESKE